MSVEAPNTDQTAGWGRILRPNEDGSVTWLQRPAQPMGSLDLSDVLHEFEPFQDTLGKYAASFAIEGELPDLHLREPDEQSPCFRAIKPAVNECLGQAAVLLAPLEKRIFFRYGRINFEDESKGHGRVSTEPHIDAASEMLIALAATPRPTSFLRAGTPIEHYKRRIKPSQERAATLYPRFPHSYQESDWESFPGQLVTTGANGTIHKKPEITPFDVGLRVLVKLDFAIVGV